MPRYNIQSCATGATAIGFSNTAALNVGTVYKKNDVCWLVVSFINSGQGNIGEYSLENPQASYSGTNACTQCTQPNNPPSGGGGGQPTTAYNYSIIDCNTGVSVGTAFHNTNNALGNRGIVLGPGNVCRRLQYLNQGNPSQNSTNITNIPTTDNACPCTNNTSGGGGGGGQPTPKKYVFTQCTGTATTIGYRNQGDLIVGDAILINNICYRVTTVFGDMNNPGTNYSSNTICSCPVSGGGGPGQNNNITYWEYDVQNCQNPTTSGKVWSTTNIALNRSIVLDNSCFNIYYKEQKTGPAPALTNITNFPTYNQCACQTQQTQGGSGTPGTNVTVYYCNNGVCTAFTYDPNNQDGNDPPTPNYPTPQACQQSGCIRYSCGVNGCEPAVGGQYASFPECANNCQTVQPPGEPWYRCTLENCSNVDDIISAYRTTLEGLNQIYRFNQTSTSWECYRLITVTQENSPTAQKVGPNLDGKPTYQNCTQCLPDVTVGPTGGPTEDPNFPVCCFIGDTQVAMADGSYCKIENISIGDEVKTSAGLSAKVVDKITPIVGDRGLLSINNGKAFATPDHIFKSIDGLWITANIELSRKSFKAFDKILQDGGIIKQLSIGDRIITENGPVVIEAFEIINSGIFDDTVVYDLKLDSDSDHTYFVDSYAAHNCSPEDLPLCVQFPDHPDCVQPSPCIANPCLPECPKDCAQCPSDPRCNPDPPGCEAVPEPVQGDVLISWYSGWPNYQQRQGYDFNWMIDDCWKWKYCVCKVQPDPNEPYAHDFVVCLCGENLDTDVPNPCPLAGTLVRYECRNSSYAQAVLKLEKWGIYTNGSCGTYEQLIETNSVFCGATPTPTCPTTGTLVRTYCINLDKYGEYNDGNCGTYIERIETNSKSCGYVDPPPPPPPPPPKVIKEPTASARVYYPINTSDTLKTIDVTSFALWSNDTPFLVTPSTQSLSDTSSLSYILSVYDKSPSASPTCSAELQYNIIYADYEGKGAKDLGGLDNQTLTKAMYTQYAHVLLPHLQEKFNFNGEDEDYVYIIDISRKRFKQSLDPGNWEMTFSSASFSLDESKNSILTDMYTASYRGSTLTVVDTLTKRPSVVKPVYLSSKSYDVVIGTIEDGVGSTYVTASIASASLAVPSTDTYINTSTLTNNSTVTVQGARVYYWGLDGTVTYRIDGASGSVVDVTPPSTLKNINPVARLVSSSYTMSLKEINTYYNVYEAIYEGGWTGSFNLPTGSTLSPTRMSGSCRTAIWYNSDFQASVAPSQQQVLEGFTFTPTKDLSKVTTKQKLTVNSVTYDGNLKWRTQPLSLDFLFSGSVSYNKSAISGSYQPDVTMAFVADAWGLQDFVEDPVNPKDTNDLLDNTYFDNYSDLDNGFILVPVRKTSYGRVYPSHGIIVLSGKKLDELGLNTNRSIDKDGFNTYRLYHSMKLVLDNALTDLSGDPLAFYARGVDIKRSARYFVTLKNSHLNYSNNPTYVSGSEGDIVDSFLRQNKAYFSSIGLYNDEKELLAIGKISKPIMSSLTDEMLFTVKVTQ